MKLFLLLTVICLHFVKTVSILCYRCDDSTDDKEIADCAYHVRTLAHQRYLLDTKERGLKELSYLKNCSNYVDDYGIEIFQYCKIEIIQSFGKIRFTGGELGQSVGHFFANTVYSVGVVIRYRNYGFIEAVVTRFYNNTDSLSIQNGTTNGYLRDCSDGVNFASLNVTRLQNLNADNQSTCGFSQQQGATQCIQLCTGDFCNGPLSDGHRVSLSVYVSILYAVAGLIFKMNRNVF